MGNQELFQHYVDFGQANDEVLARLLDQVQKAASFDAAWLFEYRTALWSLRARLDVLPVSAPLVMLLVYERARLDAMEVAIRALMAGRQENIAAVMAVLETAQQRLLKERQRLKKVFADK